MKASNSFRHGLCRSTIRRRIFGNNVDHFASCSLDKKRGLVDFMWDRGKFTSDCDLGPSDDGSRPVSCQVFFSWCLTWSTLAYCVGPNTITITITDTYIHTLLMYVSYFSLNPISMLLAFQKNSEGRFYQIIYI